MDYDDKAVRAMLVQVLALAIQDLHRPKHSRNAQLFLDSKMLDWIADALDLPAPRIRRRIAEGIDPTLLKGIRRAHRGKNGGALTKRAMTLN